MLSEPAGTPDVILIATGSEVSLAVDAAKLLEGEGHERARRLDAVVGAFRRVRTTAYRESVLPPAVRARVSIEAGATLGWRTYVGDRGIAFGIDHFGASAPAGAIAKEYGFTPEHIAEIASTVCAAARVAASRLHRSREDAHAGENQIAKELADAGQSVWLDNIRRSMFASGELKRLIDLGLRGMT